MRTFQYSDAKSHKFWNIEVSGKSFTVTYGKIGTDGQSQTKSFATPEKAQSEADKLIREKTGKGYVETTPRALSSDAEALELAILANPSDAGPWSAYADYLTERGDNRGEFMQVQLALEDESRTPAERRKLAAREKELLEAHEREWLGPLAAVTLDAEPTPYWEGSNQSTRPPVTHRFARGWLERIEFHNLTVNQARALARSPGARLLRELVVETIDAEVPTGRTEQYINSHYDPGPDVPDDVDAYGNPGLHALCRCPLLAGVRYFQLGESVVGPGGKEEEYFNCHTNGELAYHLVKQMPNIAHLHLLAHNVDGSKIFALPMPHLRGLELFHSRDYPLDRLAANKSLTNLTTIRCHPHAMEYGDEEQGAYIRLSHLRAICQSPHLMNLKNLALRLTDFGDKGAKVIVESGILKRLKVLDLQRGCITDEGAELLAACPDLKNLDYLDLGANAITEKGQKALRATKVNMNLAAQHGETGESEGDEMPQYLFEGDIE